MDKNYATGWNELITKNSWMLFKIMGEFVEGFEKMGLHNPCISIFGSARTLSNHADYKLASEIAQRIVKLGFRDNDCAPISQIEFVDIIEEIASANQIKE